MKSGLGPFPPETILPANLITGSGTTDFIAVFTAAQTLGNSLVKQVAGIVTLQGTAGLTVPKATILNSSKTDSFTPLQLQASVIDLIFSVEATGKIWTINASAAAGKLIINGNGQLILNAGNGSILIQDAATSAMSDIEIFPNVLAMGIPAGLKLSGRNLTDSARRVLKIAMHPTIDNCVLFSGVGKYCFDDNIDIIRSAAALITFSSAVTGDADFRFRLNADGKVQWGPGGVAPDTALERTGAGKLKITNSLGINIVPLDPFHVAGITRLENSSTLKVLNVYRTGSGTIRGFITADGHSQFRTIIAKAASISDVPLKAEGASATHTGDLFHVSKTTGSDFRLVIKVDGKSGFGETAPVSAIDIDDAAGGTDNGYITLQELSGDPPAPATNHMAFYLKDVGGKTALFGRFNTGAAQQIIIEP